jgi:hypothetical protein
MLSPRTGGQSNRVDWDSRSCTPPYADTSRLYLHLLYGIQGLLRGPDAVVALPVGQLLDKSSIQAALSRLLPLMLLLEAVVAFPGQQAGVRQALVKITRFHCLSMGFRRPTNGIILPYPCPRVKRNDI